MEVCKPDPALGSEEFERQIKGWYVRDVSNIILVPKNNGRSNEVTPIDERNPVRYAVTGLFRVGLSNQ